MPSRKYEDRFDRWSFAGADAIMATLLRSVAGNSTRLVVQRMARWFHVLCEVDQVLEWCPWLRSVDKHVVPADNHEDRSPGRVQHT